jgi:hypothetical protein
VEALYVRDLRTSITFKDWWLYLPDHNLKLYPGIAPTAQHYLLSITLADLQEVAGGFVEVNAWLGMTHQVKDLGQVTLPEAVCAFAHQHQLFDRLEFDDAFGGCGDDAFSHFDEQQVIDQLAIFDQRPQSERALENEYASLVTRVSYTSLERK